MVALFPVTMQEPGAEQVTEGAAFRPSIRRGAVHAPLASLTAKPWVSPSPVDAENLNLEPVTTQVPGDVQPSEARVGGLAPGTTISIGSSRAALQPPAAGVEQLVASTLRHTPRTATTARSPRRTG